MACPFGVPKYTWDVAMPRMGKCIMCHEKRLMEGKQPACTEVCPAHATIFGDRDELLALAHEHIKEEPKKYVPEVYGEHVAGGTSVLYLSSIPFGELGFPTGLLGVVPEAHVGDPEQAARRRQHRRPAPHGRVRDHRAAHEARPRGEGGGDAHPGPGAEERGRRVMKRLPRVRITFWRVAFLLIFAIGLYATIVRFGRGLGAASGLSDEFPWGLWIGFDVMCGVALAAGGFTVAAVVYVLGLKKYEPILRPSVLTAFLGYVLVAISLLYDLGRPYRMWHH